MLTEIILIIVASVTTGATGLATWTVKESRTAEQRSKAMVDATHRGLVALLRDRLQTNFDEINTKRYSTHAESRNWSAMFKVYKELGGNGHIDLLAEHIKELPTENR